jgi:hypothetical protein
MMISTEPSDTSVGDPHYFYAELVTAFRIYVAQLRLLSYGLYMQCKIKQIINLDPAPAPEGTHH